MNRIQFHIPGLVGMVPGLINEDDKRLLRDIEFYRINHGARQATVATEERHRAHLEAVLTAYEQYMAKVFGQPIKVSIRVFPDEENTAMDFPFHQTLGTTPRYIILRTSPCPSIGRLGAGGCPYPGYAVLVLGSLRAPPAAA